MGFVQDQEKPGDILPGNLLILVHPLHLLAELYTVIPAQSDGVKYLAVKYLRLHLRQIFDIEVNDLCVKNVGNRSVTIKDMTIVLDQITDNQLQMLQPGQFVSVSFQVLNTLAFLLDQRKEVTESRVLRWIQAGNLRQHILFSRVKVPFAIQLIQTPGKFQCLIHTDIGSQKFQNRRHFRDMPGVTQSIILGSMEDLQSVEDSIRSIQRHDFAAKVMDQIRKVSYCVKSPNEITTNCIVLQQLLQKG